MSSGWRSESEKRIKPILLLGLLVIRRLHSVGRMRRDRAGRVTFRGFVPRSGEHWEDGKSLVGNASKVDVILLAKRAGV